MTIRSTSSYVGPKGDHVPAPTAESCPHVPNFTSVGIVNELDSMTAEQLNAYRYLYLEASKYPPS